MLVKDSHITRRGLQPADRESLGQLLAQIKPFGVEDQILAMGLINIALEDPNQKDYLFVLAAGEEDSPEGYACFGPTPLTQGTYTLYWIAVDPAYSGQGIGTTLLRWVEEEILALRGRMIVLETSSRPDYAQTRHFYIKNGYSPVESIPDFYRVGEDRVTYIKKIG